MIKAVQLVFAEGYTTIFHWDLFRLNPPRDAPDGPDMPFFAL